jgi:ATP-binding cassette subfamily F protein 3
VGTVLVISHDRYFLDKVVDNIVELQDGQLTGFLGGYTDYLDAINNVTESVN